MNRFDFRTWNDFPEECHNIEPGCAVIFIPMDADDNHPAYNSARQNSLYIEKFASGCRFSFKIDIKFVRTNDSRLVNRIVARRINFGSLDTYSVITADFSNTRNIGKFVEEYFDYTSGNSERVKVVDFDHTLDGTDIRGRMRMMSDDDLFIGSLHNDEDEWFIRDLEKQRDDILDRVAHDMAEYIQRDHRLPSSEDIRRIISGRIQLDDSHLSRIVVDRDLKICLPGFDDIELPFSALQKTIYILFLKHPEGIVLSDMTSYRDELQDIYEIVIPNREEDLAQITLDRLTDPMDNESLRQQLSKIKRIVKAKIASDSIAEKYFISGKRGYPYSIHIDPNMITMPRVLSR